MSGAPGSSDDERCGRTLKTAVSVLQVLRMVEQRSDGVTPEEVARTLAKSEATANYLLNSLCKEGYAYQERGTGRFMATRLRRLSAAAATGWAAEEADKPSHAAAAELSLDHERLRDAVDEVYGLTRHRSYLATADFGSDLITVQEMRGRQGLPTVPGLQPTIRGEAHALALGKALLAQQPDIVDSYIDAHGLTAFTPRTVATREGLEDELNVARRAGYAVDREEYAEGIWCLAVPICNQEGGPPAALGISLSKSQVGDRQRNALEALHRVAREIEAASAKERAEVAPEQGGPVPSIGE